MFWNKNKKKNSQPAAPNLTDVVLQMGRDEGFIKSDSFTFIPEIYLQADTVGQKIMAAIQDYHEEDPDVNVLDCTFAWCAYAGMGAVCHWNTDWPALSSKGIYETLTEEKGVFAMDEYVIDAIGMEFDSEEEHALRSFLKKASLACQMALFDGYDGTKAVDIKSGANAMYSFGMVYEMNRIGML